jgi:hypothetical protein
VGPTSASPVFRIWVTKLAAIMTTRGHISVGARHKPARQSGRIVAFIGCALMLVGTFYRHRDFAFADTGQTSNSAKSAQLPWAFRGVKDLTDDQIEHIVAIQKNLDDQVAQLRKLAIANQEALLNDRQRAEVEDTRAKARAKREADAQAKPGGAAENEAPQDGDAPEVNGKKLQTKSDFEALFSSWRLMTTNGPGGETETTGFLSSFDKDKGEVRVDWAPWGAFEDSDKRTMAKTFSAYFKLCGEKGTVDVINRVNGKLYLKMSEDGTITVYDHL